MIYGIGTDLVEISRIKNSIDQFGDRFLDRIYTKDERNAAAERDDAVRFYALRWAAKEAAWKALSPGYQNGVGWKDLEIQSDEDGKPELILHGAAAEFFTDQTDGRGETNISLSDDGGMALAFVVLSKR